MVTGRLALALLGVLLASAPALAQGSAEFDEAPDAPYDDEEYDEPSVSLLDFPAWRDFTSRVQRHVDAEGLLRARRWGNVVNGVLLGVTGPVALAISTFGMKLSNVVLSLYVTGFGGLLASLELGLAPVAPWVAKNLSYLTTGNGRTALLVFAGNLVWAFGRTGLVPALLTCANAVFNANFNKIMSFVQADDDVVSMDSEPEYGDAAYSRGEEEAPAEAPPIATPRERNAKAKTEAAMESTAEATAEETSDSVGMEYSPRP